MATITNYYFIHIPKNMGTCIYHFEPTLKGTESNSNQCKYYGMYNNIEDYRKQNNIVKSNKTKIQSSFSIDHCTLLELYEIGTLTEYEIQNKHFILIFRDPIDRIYSLCKYWNITPEQLRYNIEHIDELEKRNYILLQHFQPQINYIDFSGIPFPIKYTIFPMNETGIDNLSTLLQNIEIKKNRINSSRTENIINYRHLFIQKKDTLFFENYYKQDIIFWNQLTEDSNGTFNGLII